MKLFVYGTLRRGQRHHDLMASARYEGDAAILGQIRMLGDYPALLPGHNVIIGELYSWPNLPKLDQFEGPAYVRCAWETTTGEKVWVYALCQAYEVERDLPIESDTRNLFSTRF